MDIAQSFLEVAFQKLADGESSIFVKMQRIIKILANMMVIFLWGDHAGKASQPGLI